MVFLRLEVRVYPREQTPPSPGLFGSIMGRNDRSREEPNTVHFASLMLDLEKPEEVTMADLALMIVEEWRVVRPDQDPIEIKKMMDDAHPNLKPRLDWTVERVFVDRGKARKDGYDQYGIVRVITKPYEHCPQRFPSVDQDIDGAMREAMRKQAKDKTEAIAKRFSPIAEERDTDDLSARALSPDQHRDIPLSSVEVETPGHTAETQQAESTLQRPSRNGIAGTPPISPQESEELGESSSPEQHQENGVAGKSGTPEWFIRQTTKQSAPKSTQEYHGPQASGDINSRKRKQTPEQDQPSKEPRLEEPEATQSSAAESLPEHLLSPSRRRQARSFASPHRRPSIPERPSNFVQNGLGLGITQSPSRPKPTPDLPSSQNSFKVPQFPSSALNSSQNGHIEATPKPSALRKDSPADRSQKRLSVSFAGSDDPTRDSDRGSQSTPRNTTSKPQAPTSFPRNNTTPSSSQASRVCYQRVDPERIKQIQQRVGREKQAREEAEEKLKDRSTDPKCLPILEEISAVFAEINRRNDSKKRSRDNHQRIETLRNSIPVLIDRLHEVEKTLTTKKRKSSAAGLPNEPSTVQPSANEPALPHNDTTVTRAIPAKTKSTSPPAAAVNPTWSFDSAKRIRRSSNASTASTRSRSQHVGTTEKSQKTPSPSVTTRSSQRKSLKVSKPLAPIVISSSSSEEEDDDDDDDDDDDYDDDEGEHEKSEQTEDREGSRKTDVDNQLEGEKEKVAEDKEINDEEKEDGDGEDEDEGIEEANKATQPVAEEQRKVEDKKETEKEKETEEESDAMEVDEEPKRPNPLNLIADEAEEADDGSGDEEESDEEDSDDSSEDEESSEEEKPNGVSEGAAKVKEKTDRDDEPKDKRDESSADGDSSSSSSSDEEDEDEPKPNPTPLLRRSPAISKSNAPSAPSQPPSSQAKPTGRPTLKGLLKAQHDEQEAKQKQPLPATISPNLRSSQSAPRREIYDVPPDTDESESDSDDDSEQGDILPNGNSMKPRKLWSARK